MGRESFWRQCEKCHKLKFEASRVSAYRVLKSQFSPCNIPDEIIFWHYHNLEKNR